MAADAAKVDNTACFLFEDFSPLTIALGWWFGYGDSGVYSVLGLLHLGYWFTVSEPYTFYHYERSHAVNTRGLLFP